MTGVGVRWTIGDVAPAGFDALRLSILGAHALFGPAAAYAVCVNTIAADAARARTGAVPPDVRWIQADGEIPRSLREHFDAALAEGVAWKLAPLRVFPDRHEISLDNDCVLWALPDALAAWLGGRTRTFVLAEDVRASYGRFAGACPDRALNAGIRGLPPGFDLERALVAAVSGCGVLTSELDEQGLQVAALASSGAIDVVRLREVSICSPFWPHRPALGTHGAHFVGLNTRRFGWTYYGRPAEEVRIEHWLSVRDEVERRVTSRWHAQSTTAVRR